MAIYSKMEELIIMNEQEQQKQYLTEKLNNFNQSIYFNFKDENKTKQITKTIIRLFDNCDAEQHGQFLTKNIDFKDEQEINNICFVVVDDFNYIYNQCKKQDIKVIVYDDEIKEKDLIEMVIAPDDFQKTAIFKQDNIFISHFYNYLEQKQDEKNITTGFEQLDFALNGGFAKGQLYVIAAAPGTGKTAFCQQIALNTLKQNNKVIYFTLEMSRNELTQRAILQNGYNPNKNYRLSRQDFYLKTETKERVKQEINNLFHITKDKLVTVESVAETTTNDIKNTIKKYLESNSNNNTVVIIDYLQLIQIKTDEYLKSDKEKIDKIILELKLIARDKDIPIILISSLNRGGYNTDKKPSIADLKESGGIEYTASTIIMLYKEQQEQEEEQEINKPVTINMIIPKNRNGRTIFKPIKYEYWGENYFFVEKRNEYETETNANKKIYNDKWGVQR